MDEPDSELVAALTRALRTEADEITASPDAWASVQARVERGPRHKPAHGRAGRRAVRGRPVWLGPMTAVLTLGLVLAGLVLITTNDLHRTAAPEPARSPSAATTDRGRTVAAGDGFRPTQPRVAWTIYRAGPDGLYTDAVPATAPYDPVQAMDALFQQDPTVAGADVVPRNETNRVASLTYADSVVHLDMAAVDDQTRPAGAEGAAQARRWVDAWVRTAGAMFVTNSTVLITLNGSPTTLYGVVDTTQPLFPMFPVKRPAALYFPADSSSVTSPVAIAAMPSAVGDRLVVRDAKNGGVVATVVAEASGLGQTVLTLSPDLARGDYTVSLVLQSGQSEPRHRFTVSGSSPSSARVPVTNPATSVIATTLIYYPGPDQHLLAEPRPRTSLTDAVAAISGEPSGNDASWPFGSLKLKTVHDDGDEVVVDYSGDDKVRPGDPDAAVAAFWAQSLVHTVSAYEGRPTAVRVTLRGRPFRLFGLLDTSDAFSYRAVGIRTTEDLALPTNVSTPGPLRVVGAAGAEADHVTWYVVDGVSLETLYQGNVPVGADRVFAFALPVPAGRYELRVDVVSSGGRVLQSYDRSPEVS